MRLQVSQAIHCKPLPTINPRSPGLDHEGFPARRLSGCPQEVQPGMRILLGEKHGRQKIPVHMDEVTRVPKSACNTFQARPKPAPELPMPLFLGELRRRGKMNVDEVKPAAEVKVGLANRSASVDEWITEDRRACRGSGCLALFLPDPFFTARRLDSVYVRLLM